MGELKLKGNKIQKFKIQSDDSKIYLNVTTVIFSILMNPLSYKIWTCYIQFLLTKLFWRLKKICNISEFN